MANPDDILIEELTQAREQGDDARVLGLAGAILAQNGADRRALVWLEEAAERLIAASRGQDLDAALGWAQTWARQARSPRARERVIELQERIVVAQAAGQALHDALASGDLGALRAALAALPPSDRRRDSRVMAERALALLSEREREAAALRRDLADLMPGRLERALGVATRLAAIDSTATPRPPSPAARSSRWRLR